MSTHVLVCDIETVPDLRGFAVANGHVSKPESPYWAIMSASPSCGHAAAIALVRVVPLGDRAFVVSVIANHPGLTEEEAIEHLWLAGGL
jgi:hypothetical protein